MGTPRKLILHDDCFAHITFRCLNREYYFAPKKIKDYLMEIWETYAPEYGLKWIDHIIMDNHAHILIYINKVEDLSNFMRTTNSLLSKKINQVFDRDGHALKERFKSPLITSESHFYNCIGYVWLNRYRIKKESPQDFKYSSLYYRHRGIKNKLLTPYSEFGLTEPDKEKKFVRKHLANVMKTLLDKEIFEHSHTIGTLSEVLSRNAFIRDTMHDLRLLAAEGFT